MSRPISLSLLVALATQSALPSAAAAPHELVTTANAVAGSQSEPSLTRCTLENGLEVLLEQDRSLPLVAINLWYHVGPVNEPEGRSGFAHLFEHLMFEGSKHIGPNFDRYLENAGATNANGTTSWDRTNYFATVPREYLELVLWLESDRMGYLGEGITQERLDTQRNVVLNERRQSYEDAPYGPSALTLLNTIFPEGHPYHGAIIGDAGDLARATLNDVKAFASRYYAPSNATLCVVGDFDPAQTQALIKKYFGPLKRVARPQPRSSIGVRPPQAARLEVVEPVKVPQVAFAWLAPPAYSREHAALEVLSAVLAGGKASRLYRNLVTERQIAVEVNAGVDATALGTLFVVTALAQQGTSVETLETELEQQLRLVVAQPPTEDELRRGKKRLGLEAAAEQELLNGPSGDTGRAGSLQRFNYYTGNPRHWVSWQKSIAEVESTDLLELSTRYLGPGARVAVITRPTRTEEPAK